MIIIIIKCMDQHDYASVHTAPCWLYSEPLMMPSHTTGHFQRNYEVNELYYRSSCSYHARDEGNGIT